MPLQIEIDDEAARLLWARGLSQLYVFAVAERGLKGATERALDLFGRVLPNFGHYAIEAVTDATPGTLETVLRCRISRTFERDIALRAFDFLGSHSSGLHH